MIPPNDNAASTSLQKDFAALPHDEQSKFLSWAQRVHMEAWRAHRQAEIEARYIHRGEISTVWMAQPDKLTELQIKWVRNGRVRVLLPDGRPKKWFDLDEQTLRLGKVEARKEHWVPVYLAISRECVELVLEAERAREQEVRDFRKGYLRPTKSSAQLTKEMMENHPDRGGDPEVFKELNNERERAKREELQKAARDLF